MEIFQNVKVGRRLCEILHMVAIEIVMNSTDGAQQFVWYATVAKSLVCYGRYCISGRLLPPRSKPHGSPDGPYLSRLIGGMDTLCNSKLHYFSSMITRSYLSSQDFGTVKVATAVYFLLTYRLITVRQRLFKYLVTSLMASH